jgi:hypothetical protein
MNEINNRQKDGKSTHPYNQFFFYLSSKAPQMILIPNTKKRRGRDHIISHILWILQPTTISKLCPIYVACNFPLKITRIDRSIDSTNEDVLVLIVLI